MSKRILLSTVVAAGLVTSAFAGSTAAGTNNARIAGLGLTNAQIEDHSNIWANPAYMAGQKDRVIMNSTGQTTLVDYIGATYNTSVGTFGVVMGRNFTTASTITTATSTTSAATGKDIDLLYGTAIGNMDIGVRISNKSAMDITGTTTNVINGATDIELGLNLKDMGLDVSMGVLLVAETVNSTAVAANSGMEQLSINLRHKTTKDILTTFTYNLNTPKPDVAGVSNMNINTSATYKKELNADTMGYISTGLNITPASTTTTASTLVMTVPVTGSVESKVNENWVYRGFAVTNLLQSSTATVSSVTTYAANNANNINGTAVGGGLGYTSGNFSLDGSINVGAAQFAGANVLNNLFGQLTASYMY